MQGKKEGSVYTYRAYGLQLRSDLPLGGLRQAELEGEPDVVIAAAELEPPPDPARSAKWIEAQAARIYWAEVGQFEILAGRSIRYRAPEGANQGLLAQAILGPATGLCLQQRGMFPLHASAVDLAGRCVAIVGVSGAGKSTLAHALVDQGAELITDDIAALRLVDGQCLVEPGLGSFRLWPNSLQRLEDGGSGLPRLHRETEKRLLQAERCSAAARPLEQILILEPAAELDLADLDPARGLMELARNIYYPELSLDGGLAKSSMQQAAELLQSVKVRSLQLPRDIERLPALSAELRQRL